MNKCPCNLDIELWQLLCDKMEFKDQNYLFSCDRNLWHQLRIYSLPRKYGSNITNYVLMNDHRYHHFATIVDLCYNNKITDVGLKYLSKAMVVNLYMC